MGKTRNTDARRLRRGRAARRASLTLLLGAVAAIVASAPASASLKQDLQRFSNCPYNFPGVISCLYSTTTSGEFVIGKSAVPITKTVTIQGGLKALGVVAPATNGETLSKTPLPVPGGLVGIELPGNFTEVTATAELAGQAQVSTSVILPLKVKLDNLALGSDCYIGSEAEPLSLHLVYGTTNPPPPNKPISGKSTVTTKDKEILTIVGTLVDNSFAAPGATGCTLLPPVGDLAVNTKEGLPAAAGTNTAIMSGTTEEVAAQLVKAVLPLPDVGRCVKVEGVPGEGKTTVYHGGYSNSSCTVQTLEQTGKYEWVAGAGPSRKFSGTTTALTLETPAKSKITCSGGSDEGEYASAKTETVRFALSGCKTSQGVACQSAAAAAGEIKTAALDGELEYISENEEPVAPVVGLDLKPASGSQLASFECGGAPASAGGSVIAPIGAIDKMTTSFKAKASETAGKQSVEAFETGAKDTPTFTAPGASGEEPAGLKVTATQGNEEKLEIKAIA